MGIYMVYERCERCKGRVIPVDQAAHDAWHQALREQFTLLRAVAPGIDVSLL